MGRWGNYFVYGTSSVAINPSRYLHLVVGLNPTHPFICYTIFSVSLRRWNSSLRIHKCLVSHNNCQWQVEVTGLSMLSRFVSIILFLLAVCQLNPRPCPGDDYFKDGDQRQMWEFIQCPTDKPDPSFWDSVLGPKFSLRRMLWHDDNLLP